MQSEMTVRSIILGLVLAVILAASNTYLALKIGILTSASIPAAVVSMGILRFFKNSTIPENNLVQTAASAGEAIAGGIVYTLPALIIIHYTTNFSYFHGFLIAMVGGILGILFSVPLRRVLIQDKNLHFPEALAITKVLQMGNHDKSQLTYLLTGGIIGALIEFLQSGLQVVASAFQGFLAVGKSFIGFGTGFSATLIGAGYLIGFNMGLSLLLGAILGYLVLMPFLTSVLHIHTAQSFISQQLRFIGIGSMLTAGIITLLSLSKPIVLGIHASLKAAHTKLDVSVAQQNEDKDIPFTLVLIMLIIMFPLCYFLLNYLLPFKALGISSSIAIFASLLFVLVVGFIFSGICGYFSGMVGVSASPGSAIVIGGLLIIAFSLRALFGIYNIHLTHDVIVNASAVVIVLISIVTGIACITNDNIQDLKVGQLVGSTPYKQQLMLFVGVIAASCVIPYVVQLLFSVYGLGGVLPHAGMDSSKMLPAPVPTVLAAVTQAVFDRNLPSGMLFVGVGITMIIVVANYILKKFHLIQFNLSVLGVAMGLYLPLSTSTALFLGCLLSRLFKSEHGILNACGLVAGAALMDVLLAIPFAISGNPNILNILPNNSQPIAIVLGFLSIFTLAVLFYRYTRNKNENHSN